VPYYVALLFVREHARNDESSSVRGHKKGEGKSWKVRILLYNEYVWAVRNKLNLVVPAFYLTALKPGDEDTCTMSRRPIEWRNRNFEYRFVSSSEIM